MRGLFVTGTDTGAGKTVVAAAALAALRARGERVAAFKPVVTGVDDPPDPDWPPDHELLAAAAGGGQPPAGPGPAPPVAAATFGPAVSPHLAARLAGETIDPASLIRAARAAAGDDAVLVAEGVGGLLVPLTIGFSVRDLAVALGLPLLVAARPGLGTINHTLLTLEAARAAGLAVRAVVLTSWPVAPGEIERSNRATVAALGDVDVRVLPRLARADLGQLAEAGDALL